MTEQELEIKLVKKFYNKIILFMYGLLGIYIYIGLLMELK